MLGKGRGGVRKGLIWAYNGCGDHQIDRRMWVTDYRCQQQPSSLPWPLPRRGVGSEKSNLAPLVAFWSTFPPGAILFPGWLQLHEAEEP